MKFYESVSGQDITDGRTRVVAMDLGKEGEVIDGVRIKHLHAH